MDSVYYNYLKRLVAEDISESGQSWDPASVSAANFKTLYVTVTQVTVGKQHCDMPMPVVLVTLTTQLLASDSDRDRAQPWNSTLQNNGFLTVQAAAGWHWQAGSLELYHWHCRGQSNPGQAALEIIMIWQSSDLY